MGARGIFFPQVRKLGGLENGSPQLGPGAESQWGVWKRRPQELTCFENTVMYTGKYFVC